MERTYNLTHFVKHQLKNHNHVSHHKNLIFYRPSNSLFKNSNFLENLIHLCSEFHFDNNNNIYS